MLCKGKQPKGVKIKYWFGIAQIAAACFVAPFSPPAAAALALSGINTTVQAAGEALDNKEQWERNLNGRQRITPDNMPPTQRNSCKPSFSLSPIILTKNEYANYFENTA